MTRWLAPAVLAIALATTVAFLQSRHGRQGSGFPAPDFSLRDLRGNAVRLSDFRGKIIFLNLWATWCPPCREEMPSMERLYRRFKGQDFAMLAVSEDTDPAVVRGFVSEMALSFPVLLDTDGKLPSRYGVTGYPETFVIDRDGNVIQHFIGPEDWESATSLRFFSELLKPKSGSGESQRAGAD